MFQTTTAIVLALQKHNDQSSILHAYTRADGRVSYMVYGVHSKKKSLQAALQPLNIVELTSEKVPSRTIETLKEAKITYLTRQNDFERQCVRMFVAELVYRTLKLPMHDERIFDYLIDVVHQIDTTEQLHLLPQEIMTRLSLLLGYGSEPLEEWKGLKSVDVLQSIFR